MRNREKGMNTHRKALIERRKDRKKGNSKERELKEREKSRKCLKERKSFN